MHDDFVYVCEVPCVVDWGILIFLITYLLMTVMIRHVQLVPFNLLKCLLKCVFQEGSS